MNEPVHEEAPSPGPTDADANPEGSTEVEREMARRQSIGRQLYAVLTGEEPTESDSAGG